RPVPNRAGARSSARLVAYDETTARREPIRRRCAPPTGQRRRTWPARRRALALAEAVPRRSSRQRSRKASAALHALFEEKAHRPRPRARGEKKRRTEMRGTRQSAARRRCVRAATTATTRTQ